MTQISYPIDNDWTTEEIIKVVEFYAAIGTAYDKGIKAAVLKEKHTAYKTVVSTISGDKQIDRQFEKLTGYSIYRTVKKMRQIEDSAILTMP